MKRAFVGNRSVNPLSPSYFYPGGTENINIANDPYGEKLCSMSAANFQTVKTFGLKAVKD